METRHTGGEKAPWYMHSTVSIIALAVTVVQRH